MLNDIKPPPDFYPQPLYWWYLKLILFVLALVCLVLVLRRLWRYFKRKEEVVIKISPLAKAEQELQTLAAERDQRRINLRDYSSRLSLVLREFVSARLEVSVGDELTVREFCNEFEKLLLIKIPELPAELSREIRDGVNRVLIWSERATYSDLAEAMYLLEGEDALRSLRQAEEIVKKIDTEITRVEKIRISTAEVAK
jgi:hypothetical protein